jgi:hypothetical protein
MFSTACQTTHQRCSAAGAPQTLVLNESQPKYRHSRTAQSLTIGIARNPSANLPDLDKYVLTVRKPHSLSNGFAT